jgi:hypothetical protein
VTGQRVEDRGTRRLRWIAHGLGAVIAGFWVFIGMLQAFTGSDPRMIESAVLAVLIVAAALAVAVACWWAGLGGLLVILVGNAHRIFAWLAAGRQALCCSDHRRSVPSSGGPVPCQLVALSRAGHHTRVDWGTQCLSLGQ